MPTDLNYPNDPTNNENTILDQQRFSRQDQARMFDPAYVADPTNKPLWMVRWNSATKRDEMWSGTAWVEKCALYAMSISGNAATATQASQASNITVTDDVTSNTTVYPVWSLGTGIVASKISSTRVSFNPSTGDFTLGGRLFCSQNVLIQSAGTLATTGVAYLSLRDGGGERGWCGFGLGDGTVALANLTGGPVKIFGGGGYHGFSASGITLGAGAFNGAGTGLTGTAASLSIGGNAATATQATNSTNASNLTGVAGTAGYSVSGAAVSYNAGAGGPTVKGQGGGAAMMTFERPSAYAVNFGLDTNNKLSVGGYSMGAVSYALYHEGNKPTVSDITDGRTWQTFTVGAGNQRVSGTTYTNTTGRTIQVLVRYNQTSAVTFNVNGTQIIQMSGSNISNNTTFDVPNGQTYSVTGDVAGWSELR